MATQICLTFTRKIGEDSHFDSYLSNGLVQQPTVVINLVDLVSMNSYQTYWQSQRLNPFVVGFCQRYSMENPNISSHSKASFLFKTTQKDDVGVSKNRGTPKWMVLNGKPYLNGWFLGKTHYFGKHPCGWLNSFAMVVHCFRSIGPSLKFWLALAAQLIFNFGLVRTGIFGDIFWSRVSWKFQQW